MSPWLCGEEVTFSGSYVGRTLVSIDWGKRKEGRKKEIVMTSFSFSFSLLHFMCYPTDQMNTNVIVEKFWIKQIDAKLKDVETVT